MIAEVEREGSEMRLRWKVKDLNFHLHFVFNLMFKEYSLPSVLSPENIKNISINRKPLNKAFISEEKAFSQAC